MTTSAWVGERVRLRAKEPEDWEAFLAFEEDSDAVRSGWRLHPPRSAAQVKKLLEEQAEEELGLDEFSLVIATKDDNAPVGSINTQHGASPMPGRRPPPPPAQPVRANFSPPA
jgi:RimJ/RimL family protein N-acetyltransferase